MERYHQIIQNTDFRERLKELRELEKDRIYCHHDLEHACDVARIMYILALEEGCDLEQDIIYATALLHDVGRVEEYKGIMPHHEAGAKLALALLPTMGYDANEVAYIVEAIGRHRTPDEQEENTLGEYLYRADKLSRNCFDCEAWDTCKWSDEKKNHSLII